MAEFSGTNGLAKVVATSHWSGGDVYIGIGDDGGKWRETGLRWQDARRLAYALLEATDERLARQLEIVASRTEAAGGDV